MSIILSMSVMIFFLSMILIFISLMISKKSILDREKISPFECGFDPKSSARTPFSLQFFLIALIFLIFDIEIILILPAMMTQLASNPLSWSYTLMFFILLLILGLYHEWSQGALNWAQ
uniref:NADH dehydrogenase subunit 3 n=1 Tax=Vescelia pieli TaxID=2526987 RepID=UPI0030E1978D